MGVKEVNMLSDFRGKTWDELEEELKKVNTSFPPVEKLDGWIPIEVDEDKGEVVARKKILNRETMKKVIAIAVLKADGIWKEVYDKMLRRELILDAMDDLAEREEGPAFFLPDESIPRHWKKAVYFNKPK